MTVDRRLLAVCVAGALLGFTGCGEKKLDTKRVERFIKQGVERQHPDAKPVSVMCPKDRRRKKGDTFKCQVRGAKPSQRRLATVMQVDNKGNFRYAVP